MKAYVTLGATFLFAVGISTLVMLLSPSWAWWRNPAALAVLAGTGVALVTVLIPRGWWR